MKSIKEINLIIEEIHDTFYSEVDRILEDAKISKSLDTDKQYLIDKCNRLKALGFTSSKEVKEAEVEIKRIEHIKLENENKKGLIEAIDYFSFNYPNYKFITEESVQKICSKYNLIYGSVDKYIGEVPEANLKHIENFRIKEIDECYLRTILRYDGARCHKNWQIYSQSKEISKNLTGYVESCRDYKVNYNKEPLYIVAPKKDFDTRGMYLNNSQLLLMNIPDPIVLCPVVFKSERYFLIVTAWGLESSDELVVNPRHN